MQQSKIDSVINKVIDGVRDKGRGFVLDLAPKDLDVLQAQMNELRGLITDKTNSDEITPELITQLVDDISMRIDAAKSGTKIEVVESLPPHDEWEPLASWRHHMLEDTDSLIQYARKYGSKEKSILLVNTDYACVILDDEVERGQRENIVYQFEKSKDFHEWLNVFDQQLNHRQLLQFLSNHEHNLDDPRILEPLLSMRINTTVNIDSDMSDDGQHVGISMKTAGGEEVRKFKKRFQISLPVLACDECETDLWVSPVIKMDVILPTEPNKPPNFTLGCSLWDTHLKRRVKKEAMYIRENMDEGWMVLSGKLGYIERELGGVASTGDPY